MDSPYGTITWPSVNVAMPSLDDPPVRIDRARKVMPKPSAKGGNKKTKRTREEME